MKGVIKNTTGKIRNEMRRHIRTPSRRASTGKRRNWQSVEEMAKNVNIPPMRRELMPKPPENLKGKETSGSFIDCGG